MTVTLRPVILFEPDPEADRAYDAALDLLADAIAERLIAEARAEVAAELGLEPEALAHDSESLTDHAREHMGRRTGSKVSR